MPRRIREAVEAELGGRVVRAVTQPYGFSPAAAARLLAANGRTAFVKAVPHGRNPDSPAIYRREIQVHAHLPSGLPVPRLMWWLDEGPAGWVVLLFQWIDGRPPALPWNRADLALAVRTIDELAGKLTPSPIQAGQQGRPLQERWSRWHDWLGSPEPDLDPWFRERLALLADLEGGVEAHTTGNTLVHLDVRSDNLIFTPGRCWLTDWAWPLNGAPWMDVVLFACFAEAEGGPPAEETLAMSEVGRAAPARGVLALVATFAGMLTVQATEPAPPGLPGLRAFQAAHARTARAWLRRLLEARA
jgi:aminoglycoside phosphotransferase (APT) family kinase protein